jgi:3-oxoacyl-[acyl-carrier protein] reductase
MSSGDRLARAGDGLAGRVALVTGGSGGIGAALCRALAAEGAAVAVGYGANAQAAEALVAELAAGGAQAAAFGADMSDPAAPGTLVESVEAAVGPVDVLVANHGRARVVSYEELRAEDFDATLAVNLRAPFLLARRALPGMRERGFGRVLFVSSSAAFTGGVVGPDYGASKAGLHALSHFLASRVAGDGVTVNVIAPGFVETAMLPGSPDELAGRVPVGRVGRPEEVADMALAILRNGFVTSQVFAVNGGMYPR